MQNRGCILSDLIFGRDEGESFFLMVPLEDVECGSEIKPEAMADGEGGVGAAVDEVNARGDFFNSVKVWGGIE